MSDDIIRRNKELTKLAEESDITKRLNSYERTVKLLLASVILDIMLSVGLAVLGYFTYHTSEVAKKASSKATAASDKATAASSLTRVNCIAANQARAQSKQLWEFVLSFPPPPNETAGAKKRRITETEKFRKYLNKTFAPRNCDAPVAPKTTPSFPSGAKAPSPMASSSNPAQSDGQTTIIVIQPTPPTSSQPQPRPSQRPSPSPSPSHRPSPTPTPTCTALPHISICPLFKESALHMPAAGSSASIRPVGIAIILIQGGFLSIYLLTHRFKIGAA